MTRIYFAEDLTDDDVPVLREEIQKALDDPGYSVTTNFLLHVVDVPKGALLIAEDADDEQMELLRTEYEKARGDPEYILVLPFHIQVGPVLRPEKG